MSIHEQKFENFPAFLEFVQNAPANTNGRKQLSRRVGKSTWAGTETWERAIHLAQNGWTDGADRIRKLALPLYDKLTNVTYRPQPYFAEVGTSIDMARYLSGDPESFIDWHDSDEEIHATNANKIVHIAVAPGGTAGFSTNDSYQHGARIVALIDLLELSGRRVQLDVLTGAKPAGFQSSNIIATTITIKRPEETMPLESIAFILAHASMLRRLLFAAWERAPEAWVKAISAWENGSYGAPYQPKSDADIVIQELSGRIYDVEGWIIGKLRECGVTINE